MSWRARQARPAARLAPRRDGFVLVTALWLLGALAALAAAATLSVGRSAGSLALLDDALTRDMLASAAVEIAAGQLIGYSEIDRPRSGGFAFRLDGGAVEVLYQSEATRIDLNAAPRRLLAGLFIALGAPAEAAGGYAERILAWRGSLPRAAGEEDALYREAGLPYLSRQGPFSSVDELWLVLGLPPALIERSLPFLTIYSGAGEIDVLHAPPEVIAALPGMTAERLGAFLGRRAGIARNDPQRLIQALGGPTPGAGLSGGRSYRITMRVTLASGRPSSAEAVIALAEAGDSEAFRVMAWTDLAQPAGRRAPREEQ